MHVGNPFETRKNEFCITLRSHGRPSHQLRIGVDGLDDGVEGGWLTDVGQASDCLSEMRTAVTHQDREVAPCRGQLRLRTFAIDAEQVGRNLGAEGFGGRRSALLNAFLQ